MSVETKLMKIPTSSIRENAILLRAVNRQSTEYLELCESIRKDGILNAISVREIQPENGVQMYAVIDGTHRYNAAKDVGLAEIPALVMNKSDAEVEEAQIIANVHKIETKPVEYSKALMRILKQNVLMTEAELAEKVRKSPAWIRERFSLTKLAPEIGKLVDDGIIGLANAYALAKLPAEEHNVFLERAQTSSPQEFMPLVNARVAEIKKANREGRDAQDVETFVPIAHLRRVSEIKELVDNNLQIKALIEREGVATPEDVYKAALKWVLNLDVGGIAVQKVKDDERKADKAKKQEAAKAERAKKELERAQANVKELAGAK